MAVEYSAEQLDFGDLGKLAGLPFRLIDRGCRTVSKRIEDELINRYITAPGGDTPTPHHARIRGNGMHVWSVIAWNSSIGSIQRTARDYRIKPIQVAAAKVFYRRNQEVFDAKPLLNRTS